jgi:hypothetical protein
MKTAYETSVRQFEGVCGELEWRIGYTSYYAKQGKMSGNKCLFLWMKSADYAVVIAIFGIY